MVLVLVVAGRGGDGDTERAEVSRVSHAAGFVALIGSNAFQLDRKVPNGKDAAAKHLPGPNGLRRASPLGIIISISACGPGQLSTGYLHYPFDYI